MITDTKSDTWKKNRRVLVRTHVSHSGLAIAIVLTFKTVDNSFERKNVTFQGVKPTLTLPTYFQWVTWITLQLSHISDKNVCQNGMLN